MAAMSKEDVIKAVADMSVMDVVDLVKMMEKEFNVSASAPVMVAGAAAGAAAGAEAEEEQTEFDVNLTGFGKSKIEAIKLVRQVTGLSLGDAKAFVEGAPSTLKEGVSKEDAEKLKADFEKIGATVEIK